MTNSGLRLGKFYVVGMLGAILQLGLISLLMRCSGVPHFAAVPIAVEIAVLHNFIWHERFTWPDRKLQDSRQLAIRAWRFHAGNGLVSIVGNAALVYCLVEHLRCPVLPSAAAAIVFCSLVNFLLADRWVFARGPYSNQSA